PGLPAGRAPTRRVHHTGVAGGSQERDRCTSRAGRTVAGGPFGAMNREKRRAIFDRLAAAIPDPTTELHYRTPFELLVAVVLSAQATDKSVNQATGKLFAVASTPEAMLALGEEGLRPYIKTIGLYNSKGRNILQLCRLLLERHHGQ